LENVERSLSEEILKREREKNIIKNELINKERIAARERSISMQLASEL